MRKTLAMITLLALFLANAVTPVLAAHKFAAATSLPIGL